MNFDLNEVGMTFLVGAFAILSADAICFFFGGRHLTRISQRTHGLVPAEGPTAALTTGVFIGLSFAFGLLVEDSCYKFHDPFLYRPLLSVYRLTSSTAAERSGDIKVDIVRSVLFENVTALPVRRTSLGDQLCHVRLFQRAFATDPRVDAWACANAPRPPDPPGEEPYSVIDKSIRSTFYFAKNRVFLVNSYYDELLKIQRRLEFSRTIATIMCVATFITLAALPVALIKPRNHPPSRRRLVRNGGALALIFVAIYLLAYVAYVQESNEYVKRIFGYYSAMVHAAASKLP